MQSQMITSRLGGELLSYKLDGVEKIHQGEDVRDDNGKVYWKRHAPVLFPIVGNMKCLNMDLQEIWNLSQ